MLSERIWLLGLIAMAAVAGTECGAAPRQAIQSPVAVLAHYGPDTDQARVSQYKKSKGFTVTTPGVTLSDLDIDGVVTISAPNVTLRHCRVSANSWVALNIGANGATIEDCEIDGQSAPGIRGISVTASDVTIRRCDIHHSEDGIYLGVSSNITIENNYIHDLESHWEGPHYDGVATDGFISNVIIRNNEIINANNQTSAVMLSNYFGPVSNVLVDGNRLAGGSYTIYVDAQFHGGQIRDVSVTRNRMKKGVFGYAGVNKNDPVWWGNSDDTTGKSIER